MGFILFGNTGFLVPIVVIDKCFDYQLGYLTQVASGEIAKICEKDQSAGAAERPSVPPVVAAAPCLVQN
jgi:formylmethanofuran:tetrahydromethanopterin formyltransferase